MTDMTNQAIAWMRFQKALTPEKPFFMYFAPGATHAPHHVPKEWIAKYKGKFDQGWDKLREETLARQISLGVVPQGTNLAPKPEAIKDWAALTADEKKLFTRQMEVFAGFGEYTDVEIGRLIEAIEGTGQMDNTLVFYIVGDNGTSAEGTMNGLFNELTYFNGVPETVAGQLEHLDEWGGPSTYPHMNRSHTITAEVEIPAGGAKGVILAQGGRFGGWALYLQDGKPTYTYNFVGLRSTSVAAREPLPAGKATLRYEFTYDGGGLGKGGMATLYVNDKKVAEGRLENTQAMMFSTDETADVGVDDATPVVEATGAGRHSRFTGKIDRVTVEVK
jgi:arylsulfatase A-like enzyme